MDKVDTYDVCNILFVRLVPNQELLLYSSHGRSQKISPGQIKDVNVTKITSSWQTPLKLDGKIIGINLRGGCVSRLSILIFEWMWKKIWQGCKTVLFLDCYSFIKILDFNLHLYPLFFWTYY